LHGQGHSAMVKRGRRSELGYAMAALLVGMNVMAIMLTVAMPLWTTLVKREKEAELIWRGGQYARAIDLFRRKYGNASPPNIDILLNEKFLRKQYKDPMTEDGEFQLLYAAQQQQQPGLPPANPAPPLDQQPQGPAGARGGIIGVVSKSKESSLKLFNGRSKYNEWTFTPELVLGKRAMQPKATPGAPGGPGAPQPGMNLPAPTPGSAPPGTPPKPPK
jgi:type II secretory pathway pseudopilin PulG